MKKFFALILLSFIALTLSSCKNKTPEKNLQTLQPSPVSSPTPTDYLASFAIFTDKTFRVFTAPMYHNLSKDVYIEAANPNIIRVKKAQITWGDFFQTLPMELTVDCLTTGTGQKFCNTPVKTLKFYINGQKVNNFLERVINPNDRALISYGAETEEEIKNQLSQIPDIPALPANK